MSIELDGEDKRKRVDVKNEEGKKEKLPLYFDGESVSGKVTMTMPRVTVVTLSVLPWLQVNIRLKGKSMEHKGIRVEFVGQIEMFYDRGNHHDFLSLVRQLQPPGELASSTTFNFEFSQVEKPYESYTGTNVRLR